MGTRGKPSAASFEVVQNGPEFGRIAPPAHLSEPAKQIWRDVVRTEDKSHFDRAAMQQQLERYCEATATARAFEAELAALTDLDKRMKVAKLVSDLSARASALALRLRLTPASRERTNAKEDFSPYDT